MISPLFGINKITYEFTFDPTISLLAFILKIHIHQYKNTYSQFTCTLCVSVKLTGTLQEQEHLGIGKFLNVQAQEISWINYFTTHSGYYPAVKNKKSFFYKLTQSNFQEMLSGKRKTQKTIFMCQNFHNKGEKIRKYVYGFCHYKQQQQQQKHQDNKPRK